MSIAEEVPGVPAGRAPAAFPDKQEHARAWERLAAEIVARGDAVDDAPPASPPASPGELVIIGSGIETVGFSLGDDELIRSADAVFFCVADPATVVWLKSIRPDAYDLYVLYDDGKVRYTTYMQMSEAMLHRVREGKRVVAVYYGHPGIFVLSTHRAIMIARREGHRAVMRAGVCALDTLCADLGVDPCHPGLQTHEATDMLIRDRRPDTRLHVVLWQVGLIGEMGFRRKGYINESFSVFVSYLQEIYGDEYPITHYVGSRYPTIAPTIEVYALRELHDPRIQALITGVSTFYLPPRDAAEPDRAMLTRLALLKPGQKLRKSDGPLREIGAYGPRERHAFAAFRDFSVPADYHWQQDTGASRFLIALRHDHALRERYERAPRDAVGPRSFPGLDDRERALLATRDPGAIQVAAKGSHVGSPENRALLTRLFRRRKLQLDLLRVLRRATPDDALDMLAAWSRSSGHAADWTRMRTDLALTTRDCLFAWTGIYRTAPGGDDGDPAADRLVVLTGTGPRARVALDGVPVRMLSFRRGTLQWPAIPGRQDNGFLRVDTDRRGCRRLVGSIWPSTEPVPAACSLVAEEAQPGRRHPASVVGAYEPHESGREGRLDVGVDALPENGRRMQVVLDGAPLAGELSLDGRVLAVGASRFALDGASAADVAAAGATRWRRVGPIAPELCGTYELWPRSEPRALQVTPEGVTVGGSSPGVVRVERSHVAWSDGPQAARAGAVELVLDPITLHPALFGTLETDRGTIRCMGRVAPPPALRRPEPELALGTRQWDALVALAARRDLAGGLLVWHQAEKSNLAATIVNRILPRLLP